MTAFLNLIGSLGALGDAAGINEDGSPSYLSRVARSANMNTMGGGDAPSAIKEFLYYNTLDDAGKQDYMKIKRAQQVVNLGGSQGVLNPVGPGLSQNFEVTPKPEQMPEFQAAQEAAKTQAEIEAKNKAEAAATVNDVRAKAEQDIKNIDALIQHPGLSSAVGAKGFSQLFGALDSPIAGTPAADFDTQLNQLKGGTFLQAYQQLKGGGQITEVEGQKAEQAIARLSTAQSENEFKKALTDYKDIINKGLSRFEKKAGASATPQTARKRYNPQTGRIE